ncbi:MAG: exopolysaccharide biosynthesis protein [Paenibacillaceae bacterium]
MNPERSVTEILDSILQSESHSNGLSLGKLMSMLKEKGPFLFIVILCVPFLLPLSIPGVSIPFGLMIIYLCLGIVRNEEVKLPRRLMNHTIKSKHFVRLMKGVIKIFRKIEKWTSPRLQFLAVNPIAVTVNGLIILFCAIVLMVPVPIPLGNALPAYAMLFLSIGFLQRDGAMIIIGYILTLISATYFVAIAILGVSSVMLFV